MAVTLESNKSITINGNIRVDGELAVSMYAEISTQDNGNDRFTQTIQNKELFNANKKEIRTQISAFQDEVYEMQDAVTTEETEE